MEDNSLAIKMLNNSIEERITTLGTHLALNENEFTDDELIGFSKKFILYSFLRASLTENSKFLPILGLSLFDFFTILDSCIISSRPT